MTLFASTTQCGDLWRSRDLPTLDGNSPTRGLTVTAPNRPHRHVHSAHVSPVDGSATQTVSLARSATPRQRHRHNHDSGQLGTLGAVTKDDTGGHVGSRVHRTGQHHRRTDRHRNRHGNRRWQSDRHGQPKRYDSGNGFDAVLASNFQSVGNGRHGI